MDEYTKDIERYKDMIDAANKITERYEIAAMKLLAELDSEFDLSREYAFDVSIRYQYGNICVDYNVNGEEREENFDIKDIMAIIESLEVVTTEDLMS